MQPQFAATSHLSDAAAHLYTIMRVLGGRMQSEGRVPG